MQAAKSGTVRYSGTLSAYYQIAVSEGSKGLWSGLGPNIVRLVAMIAILLKHLYVFNLLTSYRLQSETVAVYCYIYPLVAFHGK